MKKKNIIIIALIILGIISILGLSYAYFVSNISTENKDNSNTSISTGSAVEVILEAPKEVDDTKVIPGIKTSKEYIVKGKGDSNSIPTNASLVISPSLGDFSNYVYWHLYKSDEEITCTKELDTSSLEIKYISKCTIPDDAELVLSGNTDTLHINIPIEYNTYNKYYLVTECIDNNEDQSNLMDKTFSIDVSITKELDTIEDKIIAELDTSGKCPSINDDGTVKTTAAETWNSLVCKSIDNYGTSYYYRGNVSNNYVKFAGYYWRILRINGDKSIRLLYDGTVAHENGEASEDRIIGTSVFNSLDSDNAYVGYMYGTVGSSTYLETHKNINDSDIKKYIDTWYENNLLNTKYEEYLADNNFCNDRRITDYDPENRSNLGYGNNSTIYSNAYGPWSAPEDTNNARMSFKCFQDNDSLTVRDTLNGTWSLKYPIALPTKSDMVLGGGFNGKNILTFFYSGYSFWYMSPDSYVLDNNVSNLKIRLHNAAGSSASSAVVTTSQGVKPVINLKAGSLKSGDGTASSPYVVE